jgi:hypothetical protein
MDDPTFLVCARNHSEWREYCMEELISVMPLLAGEFTVKGLCELVISYLPLPITYFEEFPASLPIMPKVLCDMIISYLPLPLAFYLTRLRNLFRPLAKETWDIDYWFYVRIETYPINIEIQTSCTFNTFKGEDEKGILHMAPQPITTHEWMSTWRNINTDPSNLFVQPLSDPVDPYCWPSTSIMAITEILQDVINFWPVITRFISGETRRASEREWTFLLSCDNMDVLLIHFYSQHNWIGSIGSHDIEYWTPTYPLLRPIDHCIDMPIDDDPLKRSTAR